MARRKAGERREPAEDASPSAPRQRKRGGRGNGGRSLIRRMVYWCLVLAVWGVIGAVGALAYVASTLPPIQELEVPKRPPKIEIVGLNKIDAIDPDAVRVKGAALHRAAGHSTPVLPVSGVTGAGVPEALDTAFAMLTAARAKDATVAETLSLAYTS